MKSANDMDLFHIFSTKTKQYFQLGLKGEHGDVGEFGVPGEKGDEGKNKNLDKISKQIS